MKALEFKARPEHLMGSSRVGVLYRVNFACHLHKLFERPWLDHGRKDYSLVVATKVIIRLWLNHSINIQKTKVGSWQEKLQLDCSNGSDCKTMVVS